MPATLKDKLNQARAKQPRGPLWKGPEVDGVTQSLLGRFLSCRERFRLLVVEGWQAAPRFSAPLEFGNMWHACEEAYAAGLDWLHGIPGLNHHCQGLMNKYPMDREQIEHWYSKAAALFPRYVEHWSKHDDVRERTPLLQEQTFDVSYKLPSGRTIRLRGKWDAVDLIGKGKGAGVWLQENKTKSGIDQSKIQRQLLFDLQTMLYLASLEIDGQTRWGIRKPPNILGIRYNVVRRAAHKTAESMMRKFEEDAADGRIGEWFARWKVEVSTNDVVRFRRECLDPILEQLCDWWKNVVTDTSNPPWGLGHFRYPFGVYNPVAEGGFSDVDNFLETGSTAGLQRCTNLFPELE